MITKRHLIWFTTLLTVVFVWVHFSLKISVKEYPDRKIGEYKQSKLYQRDNTNGLLPAPSASNFVEYLYLEDTQLLFHRYVSRMEVYCPSLARVGDPGEGGYEICNSPAIISSGNCLVYSFGIGENWSFEDGMRAKYSCDVHSFDHSINLTSHMRSEGHFFHNVGISGDNTTLEGRRHLLPLSTIKRNLGHSKNTIIDILKLDVEGAEWSTLHDVIRSGESAYIKQLIVEIHSPRFRRSHDKVTKRDFSQMFQVLMDLKRHGFRLFLHQSDKFCCGDFMDMIPFSIARKILCCYELYYLNMNYIQDSNEHGIMEIPDVH